MARLAIALGILFGAVVVLRHGFTHHEGGVWWIVGAVLLIAAIWHVLDWYQARTRSRPQ